ncbi:hypothetical protein NMY22_g2096 [Coprinellus aureogranulatus]|nr:hypothetical protein NMY22_g2096 [Coprinellus aureogranulatus]
MEPDGHEPDGMDIEFGPQLPGYEDVAGFKSFELEAAQAAYHLVIPQGRTVATAFWTNSTLQWMLRGLTACMAIFLVSGEVIVPRESQLQAAMALCLGSMLPSMWVDRDSEESVPGYIALERSLGLLDTLRRLM